MGPTFPTGYDFETVRLSYGHTTVKAPHPIRTAKLSTVGPDQYFGRGLQGNLGCCMSFLFLCACCQVGYEFETVRSSYGHTTVKAPHPIRTAKLSTVGPDQYFGRGLQGNLGCCMSFLFFCKKILSLRKKKITPKRGIEPRASA